MSSIGGHELDLLWRFDRRRVANRPEVGNSPIGGDAGGDQRAGRDGPRSADAAHAGDDDVGLSTRGVDLGEQRIHGGRYLGLTEPGIIAAEAPNPIVNELVILPDIEKRLEAFVRVGHGIIIFPGGATLH